MTRPSFTCEAANALPRDVGLQLSAAQAQVAAGSIEHAGAVSSSAPPDSIPIITGCMRSGERSRSSRITTAKPSEQYTAAVAHLPATPAEGRLYGIQLHMDLEELYRNLDDADARPSAACRLRRRRSARSTSMDPTGRYFCACEPSSK